MLFLHVSAVSGAISLSSLLGWCWVWAIHVALPLPELPRKDHLQDQGGEEQQGELGCWWSCLCQQWLSPRWIWLITLDARTLCGTTWRECRICTMVRAQRYKTYFPCLPPQDAQDLSIKAVWCGKGRSVEIQRLSQSSGNPCLQQFSMGMHIHHQLMLRLT